jgi:hypothetical protein
MVIGDILVGIGANFLYDRYLRDISSSVLDGNARTKVDKLCRAAAEKTTKSLAAFFASEGVDFDTEQIVKRLQQDLPGILTTEKLVAADLDADRIIADLTKAGHLILRWK